MFRSLGRMIVVVVLGVVLMGCDSSLPVWDGTFGQPVARPEHPRPDFRRDGFINLNTRWRFAYDSENLGVKQGRPAGRGLWPEKIQLPYAWEAPLGGLVPAHKGVYSFLEALTDDNYRGVAWYRLTLPGVLPDKKGKDWWLVIGAVDFRAEVYVNGALAVMHEGGYAPVEVNLTPFLRADRKPDIVVRVEDFTEDNGRLQPVGKQGSTWYTRTSGIWQTVYLEPRPASWIRHYRVRWDGTQAVVEVDWQGADHVSLAVSASRDGDPAGSVLLQGAGGHLEGALPIANPRQWFPGEPNLYDLTLQLDDGKTADEVQGYFGLVSWGTDWLPDQSPADTTDPANQYKVLTANGRPIFLRCVLDQSYWPKGIYTAPSEEAIRADVRLAKSFGFNCLRIHIKSDEPVKYKIAAEEGLLIVYDIPSLDIAVRNVPGFKGRQYFAEGLREAILRDRHHPAIAAWVVFNENWGLSTLGQSAAIDPFGDNPEIQKWIDKMVQLTRSLDPYRPLEDNSAGGLVGRYEHIGNTDFNSFHFYGEDPGVWRNELATQAALTFPGSMANFVGGATQTGQVWWNSEFASFSTVGGVEGAQVYCDLFAILNEMRRVPKLTGFVLTELTDVEFELNGLVHYDRSPKPDLCQRDGVALRDVLGDDFVAFDWLPGSEVSAVVTVSVPLQVSWWGSVQPRTVRLGWWQKGTQIGSTVTRNVAARAWHNVALSIPIPAPVAGAYNLVAELLDEQGARLAANRIKVKID